MNGTTALRHSVSGSGIGEPFPIATLVVYKDDAGYGMKVSGDKPVYVQSVKEGKYSLYLYFYIFVSFSNSTSLLY